jgi:hypothetical protein
MAQVAEVAEVANTLVGMPMAVMVALEDMVAREQLVEMAGLRKTSTSCQPIELRAMQLL